VVVGFKNVMPPGGALCGVWSCERNDVGGSCGLEVGGMSRSRLEMGMMTSNGEIARL
jgi:hypothetical protein